MGPFLKFEKGARLRSIYFDLAPSGWRAAQTLTLYHDRLI